MCGHHHHHHGHGGWREFRRRGVPSREEWVERLEAHRERLQHELANIDELLERLKDAPSEPTTV